MKINNVVKHISISILLTIMTVAFTSIGATPLSTTEQKSESQIAISNYLAAQQNPDLSDEEKIKAVIGAYFTVRYESHKLLKAQDFSIMLEDTSLDWVKKEKDKQDIELYIASLFDLSYQSYNFTIDYDSIIIEQNKANVQLRQSHQVVYEILAPEISELADLPHTITLYNKNGTWVINADTYQDEYTRLLDTTSKDMVKQQIDENYNISQEVSAGISGSEEQASEIFNPLALPSYSYGRSAAKTFSYNNALKKQAPIPLGIKNAYEAKYGEPYPSSWPTKYKNEDNRGGDCTNFVSQSIFVGTSYTDQDPNYFYPTPNDSKWYYKFSPTAQGSATWIRVGDLYSYLINKNTSKRGPYGTAVGSCCFCSYLKPGDPIFMKFGGSWAHSVIVYSKANPCTSPNNITVNSHNSYLRNEPLPHWSGFSWYGVYIQGYRK